MENRVKQILAVKGNHRIVIDQDGDLAPQVLENGQWLYMYYQDGLPVVFPDTERGMQQSRDWTGIEERQ